MHIARAYFSIRSVSEIRNHSSLYSKFPFQALRIRQQYYYFGNHSQKGGSLSQAEVKGTKLYLTYLDRRGLLLPPVCLECGLVFGCDSSLSLLAKEDLAATAPWAKSFLLGNMLENYSPLAVSSRNRGLLYTGSGLTWPRAREWKWIHRDSLEWRTLLFYIRIA